MLQLIRLPDSNYSQTHNLHIILPLFVCCIWYQMFRGNSSSRTGVLIHAGCGQSGIVMIKLSSTKLGALVWVAPSLRMFEVYRELVGVNNSRTVNCNYFFAFH